VLGVASGDFPIARGTLSTLVLRSHKRNTFPKNSQLQRRVDLTNYKVVIRAGVFGIRERGPPEAPAGQGVLTVVRGCNA